MKIMRFLNNWSINWGRFRYEVRVWRHWPFKVEFIDHGRAHGN